MILGRPECNTLFCSYLVMHKPFSRIFKFSLKRILSYIPELSEIVFLVTVNLETRKVTHDHLMRNCCLDIHIKLCSMIVCVKEQSPRKHNAFLHYIT